MPREQIWPRVDAALAAVDFPFGRDHATSRLSGGQRQRLALAGAVVLRPGLLLLDEPTAMLDDDSAALVRGFVARTLAATGATCVLVDHRVEPWLSFVDRVVVLQPGGGVVADGTSQQVFGGGDRSGGDAPPGTDALAALRDGGVWLPGPPPITRSRTRLPHGSGAQGGTGAQGGQGGPGELLVSAEGVEVRRAGSARPAVSGVDLRVHQGQAWCLVGPNGAGKSTLATVLGGLAAPSAGSVIAAPALARGLGEAPHRWRPRELVTRVGSVFQQPSHQFVAATVAQEVAVGPRRVGVSEAEVAARTTSLLERLRLAHLAAANPFTLSGGEQRRLSVATMLATRPALLVLDEPTFGQDARTWAELVDLMVDLLDEGTAVVAATHDRALVAALGASELRLSEGRPVVPDLSEGRPA